MKDATETAAREWVSLYVQDVSEQPEAYRDHVRHDPIRAALALCDGLDASDTRQLIRDLRMERRRVAKLTR